MFMLCRLSSKDKIEVMNHMNEDALIERQRFIQMAIDANNYIRSMNANTTRTKALQQKKWEELRKPFEEAGLDIYLIEEQKDWLVIPKITILEYEKEKEKKTI